MIENNIIISTAGREVARITAEGKVVIPEGVTIDEATKTFWEALQEVIGQTQRDRGEKRNATLEKVVAAARDARDFMYLFDQFQNCQTAQRLGDALRELDKGKGKA